MAKKKKKDPGLPKGPKCVIFFRGELIKGIRAKDGSVYCEDGHRYLADETGRYHYADGTKSPDLIYTMADFGRIEYRPDGVYRCQESDGVLRMVRIQALPRSVVSLSLDNIHRYGRYPASRTKVSK